MTNTPVDLFGTFLDVLSKKQPTDSDRKDLWNYCEKFISEQDNLSNNDKKCSESNFIDGLHKIIGLKQQN